MSELKVFSIKKNIYEDNKKVAEETRGFLRENGAFMVNVMSSPGSGKTTTLVSTVKALKEEMNIGVIEADVDRLNISCLCASRLPRQPPSQRKQCLRAFFRCASD